MKNILSSDKSSFLSIFGYTIAILQGFFVVTLFAVTLIGERHPWWRFLEEFREQSLTLWLVLILVTVICWFIEYRKQDKTIWGSLWRAFAVNFGVYVVSVWYLSGFFSLKKIIVEYLMMPEKFYIWYHISSIGIIAGLLNLIPFTRVESKKIVAWYLPYIDKKDTYGPPLKPFLGIFAPWFLPFVLIIPFADFPFHKRVEFVRKSLPSAVVSVLSILYEHLNSRIPVGDLFARLLVYAWTVLPLSYVLGFIYLLLLEDIVRIDYGNSVHHKNVVSDSLTIIFFSLGLVYILFHISFFH